MDVRWTAGPVRYMGSWTDDGGTSMVSCLATTKGNIYIGDIFSGEIAVNCRQWFHKSCNHRARACKISARYELVGNNRYIYRVIVVMKPSDNTLAKLYRRWCRHIPYTMGDIFTS